MRGRVSNAVLVVAAGFAVVLVLVGCGGGEKDASGPPTPISTPTTPSPGESSSGSGSPAPSKSGAVVAPKVPVAAQERTESGAKAFLQFYFEEVSRGQLQPGTVDLFAISDPGCIACKDLQDLLQKFVDDGVHVKSTPVRISRSELRASLDAKDVPTTEKVVLNYTSEDLSVPIYRGDREIDQIAASVITRVAALTWVDGAWKLYGIEDPNA